MGEFDDDDFGDLYADVEVQVSSAINAIQAFTQLPGEEDEVYGNGDENGDFQEVEEGAEGEEDRNESESESEDDFNIVLNDDGDNGNANGNVNEGKVGFLSGGNGGRVDNDEEYGIEEGSEAKNGGSERRSRGKGGCSGGGYGSQYKYMRSNSAGFSSNLKRNGSAGVASYFSTFVRGDCENDGCTYQFGTSLIASQSGRNFSLPRSRTILDVNIDALVRKPWRNPGADITDFFNFGFDEDSWKNYCNYLDRHRMQSTAVTGSAAYRHARHSKDLKAGFEHEVVQEAATKNIVHCNQRRAVSPTNEISCRQLLSETLKGRAIQVEDGLGERQPSVDIRFPVERDSDVVIEIPVQDLEEGHSHSGKVTFDETSNYLHEAPGRRDAGVDATGDMLCFSASEDELPILEGPTDRTGKSNARRHTSSGDGDPSSLGSDNCGSPHISDASEQQHQVTECDSDRSAEEIKATDEPEKSATSKKTSESSQSEQSHDSQSSSRPQSDYVGLRGGAYSDPDEFHDHSQRASPSSVSELWESVTFEHHSSKDSRNHGVIMRSSDYKYVARSGSPVRRNMKFQHRRPSRMSGLKKRLDDESASHMSDAEELYDAHNSAVGCRKQRNRHHDFDSYEDRDYLYREELEHSSKYRGATFPSKVGNDFAGYRHGKGNRDCGYKGNPYRSRNVNGRQHFPERYGVMEQKWNHYRKGTSVQEMDSSNHNVSRQLITEQPPYSDNGNYIRSKRKADELHFKRKMKNDDLSAESFYGNEVKQQTCRPIPFNGRERECPENRHDRQLPYSRREVKNPLKSTRRYRSPIHDCDGIWHTDCEAERSRYARNGFTFHSYREPQTSVRVRERAPLFSRSGISESHCRERRQNFVVGCRGSDKLDGYADDDCLNDDEMVQGSDDHDNFVGRRQYWQAEVLHWTAGGYNSRHQKDNFKGRGASYPLGRTSRYKRFDSKPGSGHGRKLIDGKEPDERRYKLQIEGERCSQFDRNSNNVHRDSLGQAFPSCWDSSDSRIVVGDGKSSRCFEARSLKYRGRYDFLDCNNDLEQKTFNGFKESHFKRIVQADSSKIDGFQDDANWREKLSDSLRNDSLDIEEAQMVTEGINKKPMQKASASDDATKFIDVKNFPRESAIRQNTKVEELENSRIMEILAKMEKRRQRFQQPIALKNVSENHCKPFADSNAETPKAKVQRPSRKRKWDGS